MLKNDFIKKLEEEFKLKEYDGSLWDKYKSKELNQIQLIPKWSRNCKIKIEYINRIKISKNDEIVHFYNKKDDSFVKIDLKDMRDVIF